MRIIFLCCIIILFSCKKQATKTVSSPQSVIDTTTWEDAYIDGGVLTNNPFSTADSTIVGTRWIVTKVITGFGTTIPNDTIFFETATHYRISLKGGGGFGSIRTYSYSPLPASTNIEFRINYWSTLGGSIYTGQVGKMSVDDGIINNAEFVDNQNKSLKFLVWMKKIQ